MVKIIIEGSFAEFDTVPVYLLHQLQPLPVRILQIGHRQSLCQNSKRFSCLWDTKFLVRFP
jgi:hypothetical protein